ncbi:MAG TPA: hypothetical protein VFA48_10980 [Gammaproteobacteria bacterium]|nr:hypothetical protein [Gammaproteobacteria bacterium]
MKGSLGGKESNEGTNRQQPSRGHRLRQMKVNMFADSGARTRDYHPLSCIPVVMECPLLATPEWFDTLIEKQCP